MIAYYYWKSLVLRFSETSSITEIEPIEFKNLGSWVDLLNAFSLRIRSWMQKYEILSLAYLYLWLGLSLDVLFLIEESICECWMYHKIDLLWKLQNVRVLEKPGKTAQNQHLLFWIFTCPNTFNNPVHNIFCN
jgi:hypothetical protein